MQKPWVKRPPNVIDLFGLDQDLCQRKAAAHDILGKPVRIDGFFMACRTHAGPSLLVEARSCHENNNARAKENLSQHDVGLVRVRRMMEQIATDQAKQACAVA